MTLRELGTKLLDAGVMPGDLSQATTAWFLIFEVERHTADSESIKEDLRTLRDSPPQLIVNGMREFLLGELTRHETEIALLRARICTYPASLRDKVQSVPRSFVTVEV